MAVKHDFPQILEIRDKIEDEYIRRKNAWKSIFQSIVAMGEAFSNIQENESCDLIQRVSNEVTIEQSCHDVCIDIQLFPETKLSKCLWGATYTAVLYSFLKSIIWEQCQQSDYTTYLEILLSFQCTAGMQIPTQIQGEKHKVYQSHSVDARISKHPSVHTSL